MTEALRRYSTNKILSIGFTIVTILMSLAVLGYTEKQWQFILVVLIVCGYTHFLAGFYYQFKSFFRQDKPWQYLVTFSILTVFTIGLVLFLFESVGSAYALFFSFLYFMLHGLFNEQTLLLREGGVQVPLIYIAPIMLLLLVLLLYSVPDPTALFGRDLTFRSVDTFTLSIIFTSLGIGLEIFPKIFWAGLAVVVGLIGVAWQRKKNTRFTVWLLATTGLITAAVLWWGSLPYIYVYFIIVGYHLMTWFIFYLHTMKKRSRAALREFAVVHVVVVVPFVVAGWWFFTGTGFAPFASVLLDFNHYVMATYIHISTSFMNDGWFQRIQNRVFKNG